MLFYARASAVLLFISSLVYVYRVITFRIYPEEALAVLSQEGKTIRLHLEPGLVLVPENLIPDSVNLSRFSLKKKYRRTTIKYNLLKNFPVKIKNGSTVEITYSIKYKPDFKLLDKLFQENVFKPNKIQSLLDNLVEEESFLYISENTGNSIDLELLQKSLTKPKIENLLSNIKNKAYKNGFIIKNINVIQLKIPDEIFLKNIMTGINQNAKDLLKKQSAKLKGELFAIEQIERNTIYIDKLERIADFLKKNPEMKNFTLYDSMSQNAYNLNLNAEKPSSTNIRETRKKRKKLRIVE